MYRNIYVVYDSVARCIAGPIFLDRNDSAASRQFQSALSDKDALGSHARDFELWCLGSINDETGVITPELSVVLTGRDWELSQGVKRVES